MTGRIRQRKLHQQGPALPGLRRIGCGSEEFWQRITGKYHLLTRRGGFPAQFLLKSHRETPLPPAQSQAPSYQINSYNIQLQLTAAYLQQNRLPAAHSLAAHSLLFQAISRRNSSGFIKIPVARGQITGSPAAVIASGKDTIVSKPEEASSRRYPGISARSPAQIHRETLLERGWHENSKGLFDRAAALEKSRNPDREEFDRAASRHVVAGSSYDLWFASPSGRSAPRHVFVGSSIYGPGSILHNRSSMVYRNNLTNRESFTHGNILARGSVPAQKYIWPGKNPPEAAAGPAGSPGSVIPSNPAHVNNKGLFDRAARRHIYADVSISSPRSILHHRSSMVYRNNLDNGDSFAHKNSFTNRADLTHRNSLTNRDSFTYRDSFAHEKTLAKILNRRNIFDNINSLDKDSSLIQRKISGAVRLSGYPGYSGVFNRGSGLSRETAVYPDRDNFQPEEYLRKILNRQVKPDTVEQAGGAAAYPPFKMHVAAAPGPEAFKPKAPGGIQAAPGEELQVIKAQPGSRQTPAEVIAARPDLGQAAAVDVKGLADQVYQVLERKIRIERERRGM
ncbi:MAG: hypothetical protein PHF87_08490 [Desulfotomaculaceae bacterium]|nr:hypothetical protein [Desulfotomaculaceae bacterium]